MSCIWLVPSRLSVSLPSGARGVMGRRKARERDFLLFSLPISPCSRRARFAKTTGDKSGLELPYTGRLINGWIWVHIGFLWTIRNRLNFATVLSYIFARLRRITFKFGNFTILKTLFPDSVCNMTRFIEVWNRRPLLMFAYSIGEHQQGSSVEVINFLRLICLEVTNSHINWIPVRQQDFGSTKNSITN